MPTEQHPSRWSDEALQKFYDEFVEHAKGEEAWRERFLEAFPDKDPVSHRAYHEAIMRAADEQAKFWRELRLDIAKKSVWGILLLLIGLLLAGVAVKTGIGGPPAP